MPIKFRLDGVIVSTLLCDLSGTIASNPKTSITAEIAGLVGDRHYGHSFSSNGRYTYPRGTQIRNSRQVSIISVEEMRLVAKLIGIPEIKPEWLAANLIVSGIPNLTQIPPSSRMQMKNGASLIILGENAPCSITGDLIQQNNPLVPDLTPAYIKAATHRRGLVAWVERPGVISSGETFTLEVAEQSIYTTQTTE